MSPINAGKLAAAKASPSPTVASGRVRQYLVALESLGLNTPSLCTGAGLEFATPELAGQRETSERVNLLWALAAEAYGSAAVGIAAAAACPPGGSDLVDYAMMSSATLAVALERGARFSELADEAMPIRTVMLDHYCQLLITRPAQMLALPAARTDFAVLSLHRLCRWMVGKDLLPVSVEFSHPAPADQTIYAQAFACPLHFNAPRDSLIYRRSDLEWPLLTSNPQMAELHQRLAEEHSTYRQGTEVSNAIRRQLENDISGGAPSRKQMAKTLHLSDSTLHRRLREEGLSYQALLDSTRRRLAQRYLAKGDLPVAEVAYRLGFADCSCLARACKRWFQLAPRSLRGITLDELGTGTA